MNELMVGVYYIGVSRI